MVVFLSDNGGPNAPAISNGSINAPFRGSKTTVLEGGIRLPMLYDLTADPGEQNDLALRELDRTRAMLSELGLWETRLPNPLFREPASWRQRHLRFYDSDYRLLQPE